VHELDRLHEVFLRHGVRPTYLTTYPVARDERSARVLRRLRASGTCEIGAHHHAWETPPCSPDDVRRHVYALDLSVERFRLQLTSLTDAIEAAVGERPVSYRSGRFGFSAAHVAPLEAAGYLVESSVAPLFNERHKGGPDFVDAGLEPYYLAYDHATRPGASRLLELPISCALNRRWPAAQSHLWARAPRPYTTRRVLKKLGIVRSVWLRPSYSSLEDMMALAQRLAADAVPLLNVLFHSSEAIVGGSPYNRTSAELEAFLDRLDRFLAFAVQSLGAEPMTFGEYAQRSAPRRAS
jgi:hypothetical protein